MNDSVTYLIMVGIELAIVCMVVWLTKQIVVAIRSLVKISLHTERKINELNSVEYADNK